MKKYDVTLTAHYQKTVSVYAESPEQAKEKTKIILFDTDLINFTDDDFVCGEADITEQREDGLDGAGENTPQENEDCSDCPYFCPGAVSVCMRTIAKNEMSYQALNLVSQIRLLGGSPLIPRENRKEFKNE